MTVAELNASIVQVRTLAERLYEVGGVDQVAPDDEKLGNYKTTGAIASRIADLIALVLRECHSQELSASFDQMIEDIG